MAKYKQINVDEETFDAIADMAEETNRTMGGMVKHMLKMITIHVTEIQVTDKLDGTQEVRRLQP